MPYRKEEKLPDNFGIDWASGKEIGHNFKHGAVSYWLLLYQTA